jgi:hypothetical protein
MRRINSLARSVRSITVASFFALCFALPSHAATPEELEAKVQALAQQLESLKQELAQLKQQQSTAKTTTAQPSAAPANPVSAAQVANATEAKAPTFFGYGEMTYARPSGDSANTEADMARFVIGVGYQFDDRTRFVSELELEHAVSSAEDPGEIEVEQAYIERDFGHNIFGKAGLFLIPSGLLNESHEPTFYYGVFRNFVETAIIPTTWREGGVAVQGRTEGGLRWDIGLTTGFDLSKWDAGPDSEGQESPLGSIHQELALAHAHDLSGFGAVNYNGVPGLNVGGSIYSGGAGQGQPGFDNARVTLWEGHARWSPGPFQISGLYAHGNISDTAPINLTLVGNPVLIPENFFGWYLETAWHAWQNGSASLTPFLRYEVFNTASSYNDVGMGLTPAALDDRKVWTFGLNYIIAPGVVVKADYVDFRSFDGDRFDLGLGYQF